MHYIICGVSIESEESDGGVLTHLIGLDLTTTSGKQQRRPSRILLAPVERGGGVVSSECCWCEGVFDPQHHEYASRW